VGNDEGFRLQASGFRLQASGFRLQASGFRLQGAAEQPNSQDDWDNRPTVNSQDDWGQSPEDAQHKTLADLAQASGSDSTQHKTLHAAQRNQTTPKSKVVCSNMHQSRREAGGWSEQPNSHDDWDNRPTVNSQDDWGQSPEDAQHKTLADLAQASGSDSTQHKTLHAAQRNQTTPKSKVVCLNMHQSRRKA
jgi:rhodanese-related sulfurtransferase